MKKVTILLLSLAGFIAGTTSALADSEKIVHPQKADTAAEVKDGVQPERTNANETE